MTYRLLDTFNFITFGSINKNQTPDEVMCNIPNRFRYNVSRATSRWELLE